MLPVMTVDELEAYMAEVFPQIQADGQVYSIVYIKPGCADLALDPGERHLRPGGTVSGPTIFALTDYAAYAVILAHIGRVPLAVTTNLSLNFLRRPEPGRLTCSASLLKLGKRLAVVDARVHDDAGELVAQASITYSIPPKSVPV